MATKKQEYLGLLEIYTHCFNNGEHDMEYQNCVQACLDCLKACEECAYQCCIGSNEHTKNFILCTTCADICNLCARLCMRNVGFSKDMCELCAKICEACAEECEKHKDDLCQACAKACRKCTDECRKYSTALA